MTADAPALNGAGQVDAALRAEIRDCQRAKAEFIRWKLLIVPTAGAAALGLAGSKPQPILFALIPPVCIFVDSVCLHNDSRIMMIADFLRNSEYAGCAAQEYEKHCDLKRGRFYDEPRAYVASGVLGVWVSGILVCNFRRIQQDLAAKQIVPLGRL